MRQSWRAFIEEMTVTDTTRWKGIIMQMVWAYRLHTDEPPAGVRGWVKWMPEKEEWDAVRKEVTRRRKRAVERRKYPTKAERDATAAKKRHYMKEYMRAYRRGKKPSTDENRSIG